MSGVREAFKTIVSLTLAGLLFGSSVACAQDAFKKELVSWPDPLTLPRTTTRCVKNASMSGFSCHGLKCGRTTWTTCIGWATDVEHMQCHLFLTVPDPSSLASTLLARAREGAEVCGAFAISTSGAIAIGTSGAAALAALKPAFLACVENRYADVAASLSILVDQSCGWAK